MSTTRLLILDAFTPIATGTPVEALRDKLTKELLDEGSPELAGLRWALLGFYAGASRSFDPEYFHTRLLPDEPASDDNTRARFVALAPEGMDEAAALAIIADAKAGGWTVSLAAFVSVPTPPPVEVQGVGLLRFSGDLPRFLGELIAAGPGEPLAPPATVAGEPYADYDESRSLSRRIGEKMRTDFKIALMPLAQGGKKEPGVILFFAPGLHWSHRHLNKHGATYLAEAPATFACAQFLDMRHRATCLKYAGKGGHDAAALAEDLRAFRMPEETVKRFLDAAARFWPQGRAKAG